MTLSREAELVSGVTLLAVLTVMYGGWTLLGILTHGSAGAALPNFGLTETQWALWRAGHAHAGVWLILSLVVQLLLDSSRLSPAMRWLARICAPAAAVAMSAGLFGVAFLPAFRWVLYAGALCLALSLVLTSVGLLRKHPALAPG